MLIVHAHISSKEKYSYGILEYQQEHCGLINKIKYIKLNIYAIND